MISKRVSKPFEDFYRLSQRSRSSRFIYGLLTGLLVWFAGIFIAFIFNPFVGNNTFFKTFLHDLPGFTLILGLVLLLELWGLIPRLE
ncbi:MAG: hypothetical protein ACW98I_15950 [Candidatus Hodarchaeales archaeon]